MKLTLDQLHVPLADFALELSIKLDGGVIGIAGPSGAGKTTLLDVVAGLRRPRAGRVMMDGTVLSDASQSVFVPPQQRRVGYVPQDLALFPHFSARQNLLYGHGREDDGNPLFSFDHVVSVLEIGALLARGVNDLSGGEKQRVAVGRALLTSPRCLLLDEPLTNLEAKLRGQILEFLKRIHTEFKLPMLFVSHQREELGALCDSMLLLERGRLVQ